MKDTRIVLPLVQTVFLPQNAMGVRYIDRVRTKVYVDNLSRPAQGPACLQGFYELDLEYHGLEGQRLYKHRVMLPLRAELPADWPPGVAGFEAADLHCVITKPMLRILSPYVLEFGAGLAVEYVGDRACAKEEPVKDAGQTGIQADIRTDIRTDIEDEMQEEARRLESKFGWGLAGQPRQETRTAAAEPEERSLPVWQPKRQSEDVKEAAQPVAAEAEEHSLPVWQPKRQPEDVKAVVQPVAAEPEEHSLPVWQPKQQPQAANIEVNGGAGDKAVSSKRFVPEAEGKSEPNMNRFRSMLTTAAISRLEARGESLKAAAAAADTDSGAVNMNEQVRAQIGEAIKEQVNNDLKNGTIISLNKDYKELDTVRQEDRERVESVAAEMAEKAKSGDVAVKTAASGPESGEIVEETAVMAAENDSVVEEVAAAPMAGPDLVKEAAASVESGEEVQEAAAPIAESGGEVQEVAALTTESGEAAAEVAAIAAESGEVVVEAANDNNADEKIAAVNSAGVRLRMGVHNGGDSASEQAARSSRPAGGFSLKYYVVKPGDDPMSIALKHNVSLEKLQAANRRLESELAVGTVLKIPV